MRRSRGIALGLLAGGVAACSAISGLDGISELACAPYCGDASEDAPADTTRGPADSADGARGDPDAGAEGWPSDAPSLDGRDVSAESPSEATADSPGADAGEASAADSSTDRTAHDASNDGPACTVYLEEPFSDNKRGWTLGASWSIGSTCASPPTPQEGFPDPTVDHTTGNAGGVAAAYLCGNNPAMTTSAATYLTSPAIDASGAPTLRLSFWRWLNTDSATYMTSTVDVFDGSKWVNVYVNASGAGQLVTDSAWTLIDIDVSTQANPAFQVRFGYEVTSTDAYSMSLWNVDDLEVSTSACP